MEQVGKIAFAKKLKIAFAFGLAFRIFNRGQVADIATAFAHAFIAFARVVAMLII